MTSALGRLAWLAAFGALHVLGCSKPSGAAPELTSAQKDVPIKVRTVVAVQEPMPEYLVLTGTLKASQETEVGADAVGKVTATFVERGQRVKRGDTLAILDARGATITANQAEAQNNLARAQLDQARRECERVKSLFQSGAISQAEYDRTTSQCQTNQFAAAAAQAQQQGAQKIVGDAVIRAPFAGVVGERFVNVGQYVVPSSKVASIYAPDPLRLELTVPEANLGALRVEMPVVFTVASFGEQSFEGTVKFISPNVRPTTRDLVVEALCPNGDERLRPGMFAVAKLALGDKPALVVPETALRKDEAGAHVFVVVDKRAEERVVQVGGSKDGKVAVKVGLAANDRVIDAPAQDVRDGARVE